MAEVGVAEEDQNWSLTSLQQRLVKTGGRLVKHVRYYWLMLADSHFTNRLLAEMVRRMEALPLPARCAAAMRNQSGPWRGVGGE